MTREKAKRIYWIYGTVLSVLLVVVGVCLILSCWQIYQSGDSPFTRESIGEGLKKIAVPMWILVAAVLGGAVLSFVLPKEEIKLRGSRDKRKMLEKMRTRIDFSRCRQIVLEQLKREHHLRVMLVVEATLFSVVSAMPLVDHIVNPANLTDALNDSVIGVTVAAIPFLAVSFLAWLLTSFLIAESLEWETALVKEVISQGAVVRYEEVKDLEEARSERSPP